MNDVMRKATEPENWKEIESKEEHKGEGGFEFTKSFYTHTLTERKTWQISSL